MDKTTKQTLTKNESFEVRDSSFSPPDVPQDTPTPAWFSALVLAIDQEFKRVHTRQNNLAGFDGEHQFSTGGSTYKFRNGILVDITTP